MKNRSLKIKRLGVEENFWQDLYHRLMRLSWARFFCLVLMIYFGINLLFATFYWLVPGCVANIKDDSYFSNFAFSVETFSTVGYGYFYPQTNYAHVIVTLESATAIFATALLTGVVFAKFSRPYARVVFSENILWTTQNGKPVLSLRLGNVRTNAIYEGRARLTLLRDEVSLEGEKLRRLVDLKLMRQETPLFALSWTLFHLIDESSALYGLTLEQIKQTEWEFYATFIGLDQDTGQEIVAHNTYLSDHLLAARKFVDMIHAHRGTRTIDFSKLHLVEKD
jgi:inward rectifier potassium channel